jgi:vacuolar-type H+-ATPase subunit H
MRSEEGEPSGGQGAGTSAAASGSQIGRSVLDATERVQQIIDAAEHAAQEIRDAARRDAEQHASALKEEAERERAARLSAIADDLRPLTGRLERMQQEVRAMAAELTALMDGVRGSEPAAGDGMPAPVAVAPTTNAHSTSSRSTSQTLRARLLDRRDGRRRETEPAANDGAGGTEEALLRATQMAVGGSKRAEIERVLKDEFGISDPSPVLSQVLGGD